MGTDLLSKTCSLYPNLREHRNHPITLGQVLEQISGESYQLKTERYRYHLERGEMEHAKRIKSALPAVMIAGQCPAMHSDASITAATDLLAIDLDHLKPGQAEALKAKLEALPYVVAAFVTVSFGLKLIIYALHDGWPRHRAIYALVAAVVGNELGVQPDMSSDNPSRLMFLCCDKAPYLNPNAQPFDWRGLELFPERCAQLRAQADQWRKRPPTGTPPPPPTAGIFPTGSLPPTNPQPFGAPQPATSHGSYVPPAGSPSNQSFAAPQPAASNGAVSGYMAHTISQFFHYNPWVRGQRNHLLLALGRRLKGKGFSQPEFEQAAAFVVHYYAESDCPAREIWTKMGAGYNYAQAPECKANLVSQSHGITIDHSLADEVSEESENVEDKNEELRKASPYFEEKIFATLPPILQRILTFSYTDRERDMLLMATLATLSAALPRVQFSYFNKMHSPPFYFLAIAPAGCGKGTITLPPLTLRAIEAYLEGENKKVMAHYKERLQEWELEKRRAQKEGRIANAELEPMEPKRRQITMAANTSKNQLIISMAHNQPYPLLTTSSELDMITGAVGADCGGHDVVFRKAFHAESVNSHFKVDKEPINVEKPSLALSLSGTPDQALKFLPSQENGLASRFSIYLSQSEPEFLSGAPDEARKNLEEQFAEMAQEVLKNYLFLDKYPTEVKFTPEQWKRHAEFFTQRLQEVVADQKGDTTALVYRGAFVALRIAAILTALRKCDAEWEMHDITCTDEDLETALSVADTTLHHNLLFSTMQAPPKGMAQAGSGIFRMKAVLRKMATTFTFGELVRMAQEMEIPKVSVVRYLKKMVEMKLIEKEGDKYIKTGVYWPKKGL